MHTSTDIVISENKVFCLIHNFERKGHKLTTQIGTLNKQNFVFHPVCVVVQ